ncbi:hypothetical protein [Alkanindiges illinoisensis]|uniref:hypothetical protein n=1 Tax=Alkanindiges illinoisensis TaxID=197183 RepID=UPI00047A8DFD|nr:hypothetical protein [Alkanindiges illinoisensis]
MGQAKQRGNFEERKKQAETLAEKYDLRPRNLKDTIKELGLPDNTSFNGYVVHLPEPDEFLAKFEENNMMIKRAYARTPILAKKFDDVEEAIKIVNDLDYHAQVCVLLETDSQLIIEGVYDNDKPPKK